ncbi:MAG: TlpA family protein disulfide reductase [Anaerolineae bacterium]|nr:TlpA family protein disulfide reductase [Anaerolineae bacterium]MDW8171859.1 TlpA disulfide reductase family protein [Anaerolineae bacterium]
MTQNLPPNDQGKPSPLLVLFLVLPLLGILAALLMLASERPGPQSIVVGQLPAADLNTASLINFQAPPFDLVNLDGQPVSLADYAGRPLILNFWQTTCEPCKREMPTFAEFLEDQSDVALLAVSIEETSEQVRAFFAELDMLPVPVALDVDGSARRAYGIAGLPTTYVIDDEGVVRYMHLGEMNALQLRQYAEIILADSAAN